MKIACTDVMVPGTTLTEKAQKLQSWGFQGIGVFAEYSIWNDEKLHELETLEERTGVRPCEFVFMDDVYGHLMDDDPSVKSSAIAMYKAVLGVCAKLGAVTEMEHDYGIQDPLPLFDVYTQMPVNVKTEFIRVMGEIAEVAAGSDAQLLLEPINRYESKYLTRVSDCMQIIGELESNNVGVLADFFHLSIEEVDIARSVETGGAAIKHVHLGDSNRLMPGQGHTDWKKAFRALKGVDFAGYMSLECGMLEKPEDELPQARDFVRRTYDTA